MGDRGTVASKTARRLLKRLPPKLRYDHRMMFPASTHSKVDLEDALANQPAEESEVGAALRTLTWASLAVATAALGLYIGRELRFRYKFRRRTPYDFFSKAGTRPNADYATTEYGMGV